MTREEIVEFHRVQRLAGQEIDPEGAEVCWAYAQILDPYGIDPDLPEECDQIGRVYFARAPGSDVWVWFGDLPEATRERLWLRVRRNETMLGVAAQALALVNAIDPETGAIDPTRYQIEPPASPR
jgi:hypothetical protein